MKIEIELSDIESLRTQIVEKSNKIRELEDKLSGLSEKELKGRAVELSKRLFDNYMGCVFKNLGFDPWPHNSVDFRTNLEHWLGKSWYDSDRVDVNIEVSISKKWRNAFLTLGIKPKSENEEDEYAL